MDNKVFILWRTDKWTDEKTLDRIYKTEEGAEIGKENRSKKMPVFEWTIELFWLEND